MDKLIGKHGFRSRGEIAKEAVRELLAKYEKSPFEMLNHDVQGVKVIDRKMGRAADTQFKPNGIHCPVMRCKLLRTHPIRTGTTRHPKHHTQKAKGRLETTRSLKMILHTQKTEKP